MRGLRRFETASTTGDDVTSRTANFCIDCADPKTLALWWAGAVDDFTAEEQADWEDDEAWLVGIGGRAIVFLRVPEAKQVKNRMHICLRPVEGDRDAEVDRLLGAGATLVNDLRRPDGGWAVLADPEGNEFCVLTQEAEAAGVRQS